MPVLVGVSIAVFALMRALPGDPAVIYAGIDATPEQLEAVRAEFGLNEPALVQYLYWAGHMLRGDLGRSYTAQIPVTQLIGQRLPPTLFLSLEALAIALVISFPLGVIAALREGDAFDSAVSAVSGVVMSVPGFWLGLLLVLLLAVGLGWLPATGYADPLTQPGEWLRFSAMPAATLGLPLAAIFQRFVRAELLQVWSHEFIRTGRSKGLSEFTLVTRHALPNAMIPVITAIGLQLSRLLAGSVIIETIFAWPGVGRLVVQAINGRDYATVQGVLLVLAAVFVVLSLVTDLCYGLLDPRIRARA